MLSTVVVVVKLFYQPNSGVLLINKKYNTVLFNFLYVYNILYSMKFLLVGSKHI